MFLELIAIWCLILSGCILFRAIFSSNPLPGPSLLNLPIVGHLPFLGSHMPQLLLKWSEKYGPVLGLQIGEYPVVVLNNGASIRKMYASARDRFINPYMEYVYKQKGFLFANGPQALDIRRLVLKNLKDFGFRGISMETKILDQVPYILEIFEDNLGKPMQIKDKLAMHGFNAIWSILMSKSFEKGDPVFEKYMGYVTRGVVTPSLMPLGIFVPKILRLFPNIGGFQDRAMGLQSLAEYLKGLVVEREESKERLQGGPRDLTDALIDYKEASKGLIDNTNLATTLAELFLAGAETTSTAVDWFTYFLVKYPKVQEEVRKEIDEFIGTKRLPIFSDRLVCHYCEAFLQECLRKVPVIPFASRCLDRTVTMTDTIHECHIRRGTIVWGNLYAAHHDKQLWSDPHAFNPKRFLDEEGRVKKLENFMPFGYGKRGCIGEFMARNQLFVYLVSIMQRFRLERVGELPSELVPNGVVMRCPTFSIRVIARVAAED